MRKAAIAAGAFSAGIFLSQYVLPERWQLPAAAVVLVLCLGMTLLPAPWRKRLLLSGVGLAVAFAYDWLYTAAVQTPAELLADTCLTAVQMTVLDEPETTRYGGKAVVSLHRDGTRGIRAVYYGNEDVLAWEPGNQVTANVSLKSAERVQGEEITTFSSRGIFLLAYPDQGEVTVNPGSVKSIRWLPVRIRQAMREKIWKLYTDDTAGIVQAILTGDKSQLSNASRIWLSEAGIYHILAVSGMHCGYLLALITVLFGKHRRRLIAAVTAPVLLLYVLVTGCSPSVVRAGVMLAFVLAAPLVRRQSDPPTALTIALALLLLQNPFAAASVSLQLSFAAVAGLLWLTPKMFRWMVRRGHGGRVWRMVSGSLAATLGALVFTVPLTAVYFHSLSLVTPLSNLLCLWAAGGLFCFALLSVAASFFLMPLAGILAIPARLLAEYLLFAAEQLSRLPFHAVYLANPYVKYALLLIYLLFAVAFFSRRRTMGRYVTAGICAALALAGAVFFGSRRNTGGRLDIFALDVGQGECVLLASSGSYALVDCGSSNSWYQAGGIAVEELSGIGCSQLDVLLLTHYDYDHVSGAEEVLLRMPVKTLIVPELPAGTELGSGIIETARQRETEVRFITDLRRQAFGDAELTIFPPLGENGSNDCGLSLLCTAGDYDVLVTGDMDAKTERALLAAYELPDIETLVVGHHGAKDATSEELLETLTPETAIISVGRNSYGHPAEQTLKRLLLAQAEIYRTDLQGTVHIRVN